MLLICYIVKVQHANYKLHIFLNRICAQISSVVYFSLKVLIFQEIEHWETQLSIQQKLYNSYRSNKETGRHHQRTWIRAQEHYEGQFVRSINRSCRRNYIAGYSFGPIYCTFGAYIAVTGAAGVTAMGVGVTGGVIGAASNITNMWRQKNLRQTIEKIINDFQSTI